MPPRRTRCRLTPRQLRAALVAHGGKGFDLRQGGMEYALTLAVLIAALILTGPGRFASSWPAAGAAPAAP